MPVASVVEVPGVVAGLSSFLSSLSGRPCRPLLALPVARSVGASSRAVFHRPGRGKGKGSFLSKLLGFRKLAVFCGKTARLAYPCGKLIVPMVVNLWARCPQGGV